MKSSVGASVSLQALGFGAAFDLTNTSSAIPGGNEVSGWVLLTGRAPTPNGAYVQLSSSDPDVAKLPPGVQVRPGATSATFTINTRPLGVNPKVVPPPASVTVSGSHTSVDPITNGIEQVSKSATLTVLPPLVQQVGMPRGPIGCTPNHSQAGGTPISGCVILTGTAPRGARGTMSLGGGANISLSTSNPAIATVPATVTVAADHARVSFPITTVPVSADTPVVISANRTQSDTKTMTLRVLAPRLQNITLDQTQTSVTGGASTDATVTLTGSAPNGGVNVAFTTSNPSVILSPREGGSITIAAGAATVTFSVRTHSVTSPTSVTISVSYGGDTKTATLMVLPVSLSSLFCSPTSVTGGASSTCTVNLSGPVPSGSSAQLSTSNTAVATVPATVPVAAGESRATFIATTIPVTSSTPVTLSASYGGVTKTIALTVSSVPMPNLRIVNVITYDINDNPINFPQPNQEFKMCINIVNEGGTLNNGASILYVVLNKSGAGMIREWNESVPELAPGTAANPCIDVPALQSGFSYIFNMYADFDNTVFESDEGNNYGIYERGF